MASVKADTDKLKVMYNVLLIDDDGKLAELLSDFCAQFSIRIEPALLPSVGLEKLKTASYDAVILDVMLPEMDGFDVCRAIREFSDVPIIMLTARGDVTDRIVGIELGANDYLPKPFEPRELTARVIGNIKRHQINQSKPTHDDKKILTFEGLTIDARRRQVLVNENTVSLTTGEFDLLWLLAKAPGVSLSRDELIRSLKGTDVPMVTRSVDILISRLRNKLKPINAITTVHGAGYAFTAEELKIDSPS